MSALGDSRDGEVRVGGEVSRKTERDPVNGRSLLRPSLELQSESRVQHDLNGGMLRQARVVENHKDDVGHPIVFPQKCQVDRHWQRAQAPVASSMFVDAELMPSTESKAKLRDQTIRPGVQGVVDEAQSSGERQGHEWSGRGHVQGGLSTMPPAGVA